MAHLVRNLVALVIIACLLTTATAAADAEPQGSRIHGSGMASAEQLPNVMRMRVQLVAKKPSLADALAALAERREAVKGVLPTLGASAESIRIEAPQVTDSAAILTNYAQLAARMGRTKRGKKATAPALPTTATAVLTAEWPLAVADAEELITMAHDLQAKVKEADLGGSKEAAQRSPEEEELLAEIEEMSYSGEEQAPLGVPTFTFVSKIDAKEKARLTAEAFAKAKADAAEMAEAAGGTLGAVASMQRVLVLNAMMTEQLQAMGRAYFSAGMYGGFGNPFGSGEASDLTAKDEALSPTPSKVKYAVQVEADFHVTFPSP